MKFNTSSLSGNVKDMTELFLKGQGHEIDSCGVEAEVRYIKENFLGIEFDTNKLILYGSKEVHFYRALHLFMQELKWGSNEAWSKQETALFEETGIMLDCSRNGTIDKQMLKEAIRLCAASGINRLYLYMEDVYQIVEEPYFGAYRGRYTYEDLKELDIYGKKAGVELIPAIQTLAHLHTYLRWPVTKKMQDTEDILLVGSKATEDFVKRMIHSALAPFSSGKIHVGMDEADLLGLGQYLRNNGYEERYQIMSSHLNMVQRICREEGAEPMIWSDMFFRLKSPTGDYYDLPKDTKFELHEPVCDDLTLVYWDYYHHEKWEYDKNIKLHRQLTKRITFAGGGWTWNGLAPNYSKAEATLKEGLASCREQQIPEAMCTFWFDNGTETPVRTAFYSALYFAQLCYNENLDVEAFERWLLQLTGYKREEHLLLDAFDCTPGVLKDNKNADNPSKFILYQDVLVGLFDGQIASVQQDMGQYYMELSSRLTALPATSECMEMGTVFAYYRTLAELLAKKAMLGIRLREAYQLDKREKLALLVESIDGCIALAERLKEQREAIWFSECRPFGFEVLDIRIGGVITRLQSAEKRIRRYLNGEIKCIRELEESTVIYEENQADKAHKLCMGGFWQNMVSAGNIAGI